MAYLRVQRLWMGELVECFDQRRTKQEAQTLMDELASDKRQLADDANGEMTAGEGDYMIEALDHERYLWLDPVWFSAKDIRAVLEEIGPLPEDCRQLTDAWATSQVEEIRASIREMLHR